MVDEEEELHVGAGQIPKRVQRPALVVLVALLGLAAAGLVTRLGAGETPPSPRSAVTTAPTSIASSLQVPATSIAVSPSPTIVVCPTGANCRIVVDRLPAVSVAALRDNYPGAVVRSSSTLTRTNAAATLLLRRTITAVAGRRRLDIVITPFILGPDDFDRRNIARSSTVTVKSTGAGKTVQVTLVEPATARPNDLVVLRLARDPRLVALD